MQRSIVEIWYVLNTYTARFLAFHGNDVQTVFRSSLVYSDFCQYVCVVV